MMRLHPRVLIVLAAFFIIYIPLFFALSLCYCFSDADFFGPAAFEALDLLSEPACSLGDEKLVVFSGHHDLISILHSWLFEQPHFISFQISSFDPASVILRC
jgi:hypothetical protein